MAERAATPYNRLFEVRLLHHYWLDDGGKANDGIFDLLPADTQNERLLGYDVRPLLQARPTAATRQWLAGWDCLFKATGLGFVVAAPDGVSIPADTTLSFVVSVVDTQVFGYTALTLRGQAIYEASDPDDKSPSRIIYRYKENVPVLSNLDGATRGGGDTPTALFLSREIPGPTGNDLVESLVLSGGTLLQLTSDDPSATKQQLGGGAAASSLPVYVNQGDVPVITPPAGVTGAPARGVQLGDEVPDDVFVLINLTAVRSSNDAFSFVDASGAARQPPPVFQVRFNNRSTLWTYLDKQTGAAPFPPAGPLPLTYFGNAGTRQKPSRGVVKVVQNATRVTQLVSEIYI